MFNLKTQTVGERGPILPIGFPGADNELARDFDVRPWRMKEERELGELRTKDRKANVAQFVSTVLGKMCLHLGPHLFGEELSLVKRKNIVGQMFLPDVYYAWIWLRIQALGPMVPLDFECPRCGTEFVYSADLESAEVRYVETMEDAVVEYDLKNPFEIRGRTAERLILRPPHWGSLESIRSGSFDTGMAKAVLIRSAIRQIVGFEELVLGPNELDEMTKMDLEAIVSLMDKGPGPNMSLEVVCPNCRGEFSQPIDWSFDAFFAASSS